MSTRKSQFTRILDYFRTAEFDEAQAALNVISTTIMAKRKLEQAGSRAKRGRKPRTAQTELFKTAEGGIGA